MTDELEMILELIAELKSKLETYEPETNSEKVFIWEAKEKIEDLDASATYFLFTHNK
jgi:hypothetical protein